MFLLIRYYTVVVWVFLLFNSVSSDVLEDERASFFGLTHEVTLSGSTLEQTEQLELAVWHHGRGDRRVRRYFDNYEAPFIGQHRRMVEMEEPRRAEMEEPMMSAENAAEAYNRGRGVDFV